MIIGRSIESRSTLSVWSLLDAPKPATPRRTVAPARPLLRKRSSNASYRGLPLYLSLSPIKTRISVRSPRNRSVIGTSQEFVAERRSKDHRDDAAPDRCAHVEDGAKVIAVVEQGDALVAERAHRGEGTAKADGETRPQVGRDHHRAGCDPQDEPEEQGPDDVDSQSTQWEAARHAAVNPTFEAVARQCSGDTAQDDVEDSQRKDSCRWWFRVGVISPEGG